MSEEKKGDLDKVTLSSDTLRKYFQMCIRDSDNAVKGGDAFRILAMLIAVAIAFFCTLGQGIDSWICFGVYLGIGVLLWLWMVLVNWKKHPVEIETPDGIKQL